MINLTIGNDAGNSLMKMVIDGELIIQPDTVAEISSLPDTDSLSPEWVLEHGMDNIIATIESKSVKNGLATTYYVGNYATNSGKVLRSIRVGGENSKVNDDIPVISTLAMVAMYSCQKEFGKVKNSININKDSIDVTINMATALPVKQKTKENSAVYAAKFMGDHKVTIFLGAKKVLVNVHINYTYVLAEGVTTSHYLQNHELEGVSDLKNKRILHVPIGEGTTEYVLTTDGVHFDPRFTDGDTNGVGKAITSILADFRNKFGYSKLSRQEFIAIIQDENDHYHAEAKEMISGPLKEQAYEISENIINNVNKANFKVDVVLVYGGGSSLMKDALTDEIKPFLTKHKMELVFVPEELAVSIEAQGLYEFTQSPIFKRLLEINEENK